MPFALKCIKKIAQCATLPHVILWVRPGWLAFPVLQPNVLVTFVEWTPTNNYVMDNPVYLTNPLATVLTNSLDIP